jgi:hypothetical protein
MPLLSQLSANGNYTIVGTFDEATYNPTSTYTKNLFTNSNWIGGISGTNAAVGLPTSWLNSFTSGSVLYAPALSGIGNSCRFYGNSVRPFFSYQNNFTIAPKTTYTITITLEDIKVSCSYSDMFIVVGGVTPSYSFYLNGSSVYLYDPIPVGSTGIIQCVITWPSVYAGAVQSVTPINGVIFRFGFGTSGVSTGDITLANPQLEFGNTISSYSTTRSSYQPTTTTGTLATGNFASKLDTSGNFYTAGEINEVTYNKTTPVFKNLLTYTESFNTSLWAENLGKFIPNATLAPDGKSYAVKFTELNSAGGALNSSNQRTYYKPAVDAQTVYTFSIYLKPAERGYVRIYFEDNTPGPIPDGGGRIGVFLNLFTGTITSTYSTGTNTLLGSNLQKLDNGWFRYSWTVKTLISSPANGTAYFIVGMGNTPTNFAYVGDGYSGMYFWGAQMEKNSQVTTYQGVGAPGVLIDSNTSTRLESSGNHYLSGTYDEASRNPNSGYIKNLFSYSTDLANQTYWSNRHVVSSTTELAPDGSNTAVKFYYKIPLSFVQTFNTIPRSLYRQIYTVSVYAKMDTIPLARNWDIAITTAPNPLGSPYQNFNLYNGTLDGGGFSIISAVITPAPNGFYRLSITFVSNPTSGANGAERIAFWLGGYNGDTYYGQSMTLWGPQLEIGYQATDYVPTGLNGIPLN